ncbi:MAG: GatB/YqeY domain-containing protein [Acidimicrobiia bacterium]|nr:GatB/YqeY domain-containing protein [Acidimicrobiia bacterium]
MSISEELASELRDAMRSKDAKRRDVIRQIQTEVARAKAEPGFEGEADDSLYQSVLASYTKKMDKARAEYAAAGERGAEMVEKLTFEVDYLSRWMPQSLGEKETLDLVTAAIAETGASEAGQVGMVVGHIMKSGREGLDGGTVNRLVREALGAG